MKKNLERGYAAVHKAASGVGRLNVPMIGPLVLLMHEILDDAYVN